MATLKELAASHEFAEEGLSQIDFSASACGSLPDPISKPEDSARLENSKVKDCMPLTFDSDEDITTFDPYAPAESSPQSQSKAAFGVNPADISDCLDNTTNPDKSRQKNGYGVENIELRRSREVIVKSRVDSAMTSLPHDKQMVTNNEDGRASPPFDIIDGSEPGSRMSYTSDARENVVKLHMASREGEFTEKYPFTIFVGTWNVNGQIPGECLKPWFNVDSHCFDIIAVGFQELDLSPEALLFQDSSREKPWLTAVDEGLPGGADYTKIASKRLVGMLLTVYVQTKHYPHISEISTESCGTGIIGVMGNKGAVSIRFKLHNSTIAFANSHLAAHLAEYEKRNQDFKDINSKLQFSQFDPPMKLSQHNIVIWLGDLNYRLDDLEVDQVKALIDETKLDELYKFDQLRKQKDAGKVFQGYSEGKISFKPTYKFDPGTDRWDTSEKGRAPAWCDRILWKGKGIKQLRYDSQPVLKLSDHKPVYGVFEVGIKIVNTTRERQVFEDIMLKLDRLENENLPQVKLERNEFRFDEIKFMEERVERLMVANTGQVPAQFRFIPKLNDEEVSKPWLRLNPKSGIVLPGDVEEIEITVVVDKEIVFTLKNEWNLEDILVLHLEKGKDFFVSISATYVPSVFGSPLSSLVKMYGPIVQIPSNILVKLNQGEPVECSGVGPEPLDIPKELWLLVDHLYQHGMREENILIESGLGSDIVMIRNYLDQGQKGPMPGSIFSVGAALLLFLESLPEPVIPYKFHNKCMDASQNYTLCKQVISQMPECHTNVFRYITAFLREMLKYSAENKLVPKILATVFGSILLRGPTEKANVSRKAESQIGQKKAKFLYHFLVNDFNG